MDDKKNEDKLMDTVPGGEDTPYESAKTEDVPTSKQRGQLGSGPNTSETPPVDEDRGQKTAENIRYGQNISESGMGGMTTSQIGSAGSEGGQKDTRSQQGHGEGSGVGA